MISRDQSGDIKNQMFKMTKEWSDREAAYQTALKERNALETDRNQLLLDKKELRLRVDRLTEQLEGLREGQHNLESINQTVELERHKIQ